MTSLVSVVLPIHNERDNLPGVIGEIRQALAAIPHEIIAVDDGSDDGSRAALDCLRGGGDLRVIALEQRSGQSAAFAAGFDAARGAVLVTLDADGQHDPADIPRMLTLLESPSQPAAVVGFRVPRADSAWKRMQSRVANAVRDLITGDEVRDSACSLRVMRREAVMRLPRFDGMHRFLPSLLRFQGGTIIEVPVAHRRRRHGRSKYGMLDRAGRGLVDAFGVRWLRRRRLRYEGAATC